MAYIASIQVADPPEVWTELGFTVDGGRSQVGTVVHELVGGGPGKGLLAWALDAADLADDTDELDGLPTSSGTVAAAGPPDHPNGAVSIDHVVAVTPDLERTIKTFETAGIECRRLRDTGRGRTQAFFRLGEVILELVGPNEPTGDGPAQFFGLAFTVADLDATAAYLGERLHPAKEAVQPGRRIATLDKSAGSTVAMAFMSAEP